MTSLPRCVVTASAACSPIEIRSVGACRGNEAVGLAAVAFADSAIDRDCTGEHRDEARRDSLLPGDVVATMNRTWTEWTRATEWPLIVAAVATLDAFDLIW